MNDDIGHFIAGFTAGEGCFSLHFGTHTVCPKNQNVTVNFQIGLRSDDAEILHTIRAVLACGRVVKPRVYNTTEAKSLYVVSQVKDLALIIVPFFRKYPLRAKKAKDFEVWAMAVELLWEIQQRELRPSGNPRGRTRWLPKDREIIKSMTQEIIDGRKFKFK